MHSVFDRIDHLVYASPDLEQTVAALERDLGVRASIGGSHPGRGTRNALIALGPRRYLEIIAPDPAQPAPATARWFGIDALTAPRLVAWAANCTDLDQLAYEAKRQGMPLGPLSSGHRQRGDGVTLSWRLTDPSAAVADVIFPFFIDWGASPHPAASAAAHATLVAFSAEHPDPAPWQQQLHALGLSLDVAQAERPALIATIETTRGVVTLL